MNKTLLLSFLFIINNITAHGSLNGSSALRPRIFNHEERKKSNQNSNLTVRGHRITSITRNPTFIMNGRTITDPTQQHILEALLRSSNHN